MGRLLFFFFFQAEDGIRDIGVTGVQTCALPISRQVLRAQIERARKLGFEPMFGSELEFYLLKETFAGAHAKGYSGLTPSVPYNLDYHVLATSYDEPFIRAVRNGMKAAGIRIESSKGELWLDQQDVHSH